MGKAVLRGASLRMAFESDTGLFASREQYSVTLDDLLLPSDDMSSSSDSDNEALQHVNALTITREPAARRPLTNKTIVLDMDLTLICTIGDGSDLSQRMRLSHRVAYETLVHKGVIVPTTLTQFGGSGRAMHNDVIKRPGVDQFLSFCRQVFKHVILWSAGQPSYVYDVVRLVLDPSDSGLFDHIYTSQDVVNCSVGPDTVDAMMSGDSNCAKSEGSAAYAASLRQSGYVSFSTKPIENLLKKFPHSTLSSTVIVDDLPCNFVPNPSNGVLIPAFSPNLQQMLASARSGPLDTICNDYCLFRLLHYFADDDFLNAEDVRKYDLKFFKAETAASRRRRR